MDKMQSLKMTYNYWLKLNKMFLVLERHRAAGPGIAEE
jgi:hypothetical protein